jgi:GAF domain-containing protein
MENSFGKPIIPANEELRLRALEYFDTVTNLPDRYFSNLARIIAIAFNAPIALISLVRKFDVFFKGNYGMEGVNTVSRGDSLCSLAILDPNPTVFKDALREPCLLANPLVVGEFGLRFYAAAPIVTKEKLNIGSVCIVDKEPRDFSRKEEGLLVQFAENAMLEIEQRRSLKRIPG